MLVKPYKVYWSDLTFLVDKLAEKLQPLVYEGKIKDIYGIPRGGLVIAVMLSHRLNLPLIMNKKQISIKTLVVDDIYETGKTIQEFINKDCVTAVLYVKGYDTKNAQHLFYVGICEGWVVMPWEDSKNWEKDMDSYRRRIACQ